MKDMRAMAALPTQAKTCVLKNNGIYEKFSYEKIVKSCLMVGASLWAAEKIATDVATAVYNGISTAEIKIDRKSTRLNSSHTTCSDKSRMPSSA